MSEANRGTVVSVRGSVVDIRFGVRLPPIHSLLHAQEGSIALSGLPGTPHLWAVGERVHARLDNSGLEPEGMFRVPESVKTISPLIGRILVESSTHRTSSPAFGADGSDTAELHLFYNRPTSGAVYEPAHQRLLPLDQSWQHELADRSWPTRIPPEIIGDTIKTVRSLIGDYLFVSLFRACAESLASENASRLAAMQRADKNIDELLNDLNVTFHRVRQSGIDEELFDVISGFEALD